MATQISLKNTLDDAMEMFYNGFACSESVIYALRKNFGWDLSDDALAMSTGFPWGLGGAGCLCGAVAGATMSIGFVTGRRKRGESVADCHRCTLELANAVQDKYGYCCCGKLIEEFPDRNMPERKEKCAGIVKLCVSKAVEILAREQGIEVVE